MKGKKLLRGQDRLLLALSVVGDLAISFLKKSRPRVPDYLYEWSCPGLKKTTFYHTVSRLLKTGSIEKVIKDDRPYFRLTGRGEEKLIRDFPLWRFQKQIWDGKWTVAVFDIKEETRYVRDWVRDSLLQLGFGRLQNSVYISPFPIAEDLRDFLAVSGMVDDVLVMVGPWMLVENEKELTAKVFGLEDLAALYEDIVFEAEKILGGDRKNNLSLRQFHEKYLGVLVRDPCLPTALLPADWVGEEARKLAARIL